MPHASPKILLVAMQHGYGKPENGLSFEYQNVYLPLSRAYAQVELFDFMAQIAQSGKERMNARLREVVELQRPELVFFLLYKDEFEPQTLRWIRERAKTMVMYLDDIWRVEFSRYWAQFFDLYTTADIDGVRKFAEADLPNAFFLPFGCDTAHYRKLDLPKRYDVSFVGSYHPRRAWQINLLRKAGFDVHVAGAGWPNGPMSQDEMIRLFNETRINLNLSNSATWDLRYLLSSPRAIRWTLGNPKTVEQIKARHLDLCGCGAFQLTQYVEGLERLYRIGEEIAIFTTPEELVEKVGYYLARPALIEQIAEAGRQRTLADHTCERYFGEAFARLGFAPEPIAQP